MAIINFGKHNDETLAEVVLKDPDWFFWAAQNAAFDTRSWLTSEAYELNYKARNITIPRSDPQNWRVEYILSRDGTFHHFQIVEAASFPDQWGFRADRLDLSVPHQLKPYDKLGNRIMISCFKQHYLGSEKARLTRRQCADFFADPNNFAEAKGHQLGSDFKTIPGATEIVKACGVEYGIRLQRETKDHGDF